jgi:hypothetical protein
MRDLREMSFNDALDAHAVLDAYEDAESEAARRSQESR